MKSNTWVTLVVLLLLAGCYAGTVIRHELQGDLDRTIVLDDHSKIVFRANEEGIDAEIYLRPGSSLRFASDSYVLTCNGVAQTRQFPYAASEYGKLHYRDVLGASRLVAPILGEGAAHNAGALTGIHFVTASAHYCGDLNVHATLAWPSMYYNGQRVPGPDFAFRMVGRYEEFTEPLR